MFFCFKIEYASVCKPILCDITNATQEERAWFNKLTIKEQRKQEKRNAKIERNNKVKELRANGVSIVAISKEMNLSRPTIYKILSV